MAQVVMNGLLIGGVYAVVAVGLNLIFGVMRVANLANGEFHMLRMTITYLLYTAFPSLGGANSYILVVPAIVVVALFGALVYVLLLRRVMGSPDAVQILLTIGLSFLLQGAAQLIIGSSYLSIPGSMQTSAIYFLGLYVPTGQLIAFAVGTLATIILAATLARTWWGRAVRAVSQNPTAAALMGIRRDRINLSAFVVGIALAALGGALLAPFSSVFPTVGQQYVVVAFLVVVIAGLGNVAGSILGAFLLGLIESFTASYISLNFSLAIMYVVFLLVLLVRPQGLFTLARREV